MINLRQLESEISSVGDSEFLELKKSTASLKSAGQTLCGFLNGAGGKVVIGATDSRKIVGQKVNDKTRLEIASVLQKFEPAPNIEIEYIDIGRDLSLISMKAVPDQSMRPYSFDGRPYQRLDASTKIMPQMSYQQLLLQRNSLSVTWESSVCEHYDTADLDAVEIRKMVDDGIRRGHLPESMRGEDVNQTLMRLNLLEGSKLTNAAVVLFQGKTSHHFMQCSLRMARFKGTVKGDFIDNKQETGNAFQLLDVAQNFIRRNTATVSHFVKDDFKRVDKPEYPREAVREALINALCHRDYTFPGGAITLIIYDDRLEIINTGQLPLGMSIEKLKQSHSSQPRNPNITNVFYRRGLIEELGIGTQKIINACLAEGLPEPEFAEEAGTFKVSIYLAKKVLSEQSLSTTKRFISERQNEILNILKSSGPVSTPDILLALDDEMTDRTIRRELNKLKEHGLVESTGKSGPSVKWFIK